MGNKRKIDDLTTEKRFKNIGVGRSSLTWAGHVERMGDEKLAKGADAKKSVGEKEARKTEITMRDCFESDLERVGEDWRKRATDRRRLIIENIAG